MRAGKIRYIGCSNFSGWHLMKSLAVSEQHGLARYVAHQAYYSLVGRDYEWELMPLALDQRVGTVVWSPLGWGRLTGKIRRGQPLPETSRLQSQVAVDGGPPVADEHLYRVVDALDAVAQETGKTVPQIALNWLLQRPTVSTVIIGARNEEQLRAEPRRGRLEPDAGAGRHARRRERRDPGRTPTGTRPSSRSATRSPSADHGRRRPGSPRPVQVLPTGGPRWPPPGRPGRPHREGRPHRAAPPAPCRST